MTELKACAACGREKPLSAYTKRSGGSGRRGTCRTCLRKRRQSGQPMAAEDAGAIAVAAEEAPQAAETGAAAPKRKRRRRMKKQKHSLHGELPEEIGPDEALDTDMALTDNASGDESGVDAVDSFPVEIDSAEDGGAVPPKPKRKRRRRRKKGTELRRLDEQDKPGEGAAGSAVSETEEPDGTQEASAEQDGIAGQEHDGPAAPRKRKRKRRRARGKSAKRKNETETEAVAEAGYVRPPDRVIIPVKGNFSYKTSLLNDRGRGMIRLRGKRETGKRWSTEIPTEMAVRMVEEGAAGIIHPGLIHKLYTKTDFRLLVLQRDDYVCRYCGEFGDTIDHVLPKSKGGLSTPANCVCACADCNLKKADSLDYVDDEVLQQFHFQS
ncbi:HNH endonuclease [Paenibacillus sacheonensis]|nr:HNH endonuclease signature motif containing protein [Paenibacillus sacheonensis]MBM7567391.1 hypothetical protein [Paenibacillus sacheonensis]